MMEIRRVMYKDKAIICTVKCFRCGNEWQVKKGRDTSTGCSKCSSAYDSVNGLFDDFVDKISGGK